MIWRITTIALSIAAATGCAPALSDPGQLDARLPVAGDAPASDSGQDAAPATGSHDVTPPADAGHEQAPDGGAGTGASDGGSESSPPAPEPVAGTWVGTTSQDRLITFVVVGAPGVDQWEFGWQLAACASTTRTTFLVPVPIVEGRLMRTLTAGAGGLTTTMTIVFETTASASGSIDFTLNPIPAQPSCSGHATVTFQAQLRP